MKKNGTDVKKTAAVNTETTNIEEHSTPTVEMHSEFHVEESVDVDVLNKEHELEAKANGTFSTLLDKARGKVLSGKNKGFLTFMESKNPDLEKIGRDGLQVSRAAYTQEEMIYFMNSNFDYFMINGTCFYDRGRNFGGTYLPTGEGFAVCKITDFADVIMREGDSNWGRHKYSYEDSSRPTWYKKKITKYNLSKFLVDYCEGRTARMDGVGALPTAEREAILTLAKEIDAKNGKK